jgi:aspartyl-tRNA(Asn)/glutamyl-tRNA(Gln) amidotransferase subunit C
MKKVAKLARIGLDDESCKNFATQVGGIIEWVEILNEVDTSNVSALTTVNDQPLIMEKDIAKPCNYNVLSNSKSVKYGYFTVPKVLEPV